MIPKGETRRKTFVQKGKTQINYKYCYSPIIQLRIFINKIESLYRTASAFQKRARLKARKFSIFCTDR